MGRSSFESTRDLLSVPPDQLSLCLAALHEWILRSKRLIAIAEAAGADTSKLEIEPFAWSPNEKRIVDAAVTPEPKADFAPRRILLHVPQAQTSTLVLMGPLPPTRDGGEFEDILLATALGGDDKSVLFDAVRTGLRASYGFGAGLDAFARNLRFLALSGEVETAKLAEAETIVRTAYADFLKSPPMGDLSARKSPFVTHGEQSAKDLYQMRDIQA